MQQRGPEVVTIRFLNLREQISLSQPNTGDLDFQTMLPECASGDDELSGNVVLIIEKAIDCLLHRVSGFENIHWS